MGAVFGDVVSKIAFFWNLGFILRLCCDMLAPRWRSRAPRWANMSETSAREGRDWMRSMRRRGVWGPLKVESNQPQRPRLSNLQLAHCTHYAPKARWRIYSYYVIILLLALVLYVHYKTALCFSHGASC